MAEISKLDRCDFRACGAAAYLMVTLTAGPLYFCRHHGNEVDDQLIDYPWVDLRGNVIAVLDVSP